LVPDKVSLSASNPDLGEAVEEIEADYKGKTLSIGFNARYLLDVLGVLGGGAVWPLAGVAGATVFAATALLVKETLERVTESTILDQYS
jgi:DNA polymerase-3 subunit beta